MDHKDQRVSLARLDQLVHAARQEPRVLQVPEAEWDLSVRLGLLDPAEIPASKVKLAPQGLQAQREPLDPRVRKGLKELQALRDRRG